MMIGGRIDLLKWPRSVARSVAIAAAGVLCATIALAFLCAALFIVALDRFGSVDACLGAAIIFLIVAAILGAIQAALAERRRRAAREAATSAALAALSDPRAILLGLQMAKTIGPKRLLPLLAVAGAGVALANARPDPAGVSARLGRRRRRRQANGPNRDAPHD